MKKAKKKVDLDATLEEIARKLRPEAAASGGSHGCTNTPCCGGADEVMN